MAKRRNVNGHTRSEFIGKKVSSDYLGGWQESGPAPEYNIIVHIDDDFEEFTIASVWKNGKVRLEGGIPTDILGIY